MNNPRIYEVTHQERVEMRLYITNVWPQNVQNNNATVSLSSHHSPAKDGLLGLLHSLDDNICDESPIDFRWLQFLVYISAPIEKASDYFMITVYSLVWLGSTPMPRAEKRSF